MTYHVLFWVEWGVVCVLAVALSRSYRRNSVYTRTIIELSDLYSGLDLKIDKDVKSLLEENHKLRRENGKLVDMLRIGR